MNIEYQLLPPLKRRILQLVKEFNLILPARINALKELAAYVSYQINENRNTDLLFICTHNSRRSHIAQVWAKAASYFYGIEKVDTFSGGTEITAVSPYAVNALQDAGFSIVKIKEGENPLYSVMYSEDASPIKIFSKLFNHPENPNSDFAAVMTCLQADESCPVVSGSSLRVAISYADPKKFDNTDERGQKYGETVNEIGREMLYVFSQIK
jgi:arsenate reductase